MEKSELQTRAETLVSEFRASKRPALVIEFAGVPKAGKTSTLNQVYAFLRRCGFRCEIVVERASVCPIRDKKHFNFNIWTTCTSLSQLLEKTQLQYREDDPDILFLDRGLFDSICWLSLLEELGRITAADQKTIAEFLLVQDWIKRISGVIAMSTSPEDALEREQGHIPVVGMGGSIMNPTVLTQMRAVLMRQASELRQFFRVLHIDTSELEFRGNPKHTCECATVQVLDWVSECVEEHILSAPRSKFPNLGTKLISTGLDARKMLDLFENFGSFDPRKKVEDDVTRIQPLPIVVVRNQSGKVLKLIRRETSDSNRLHKKTTVWAGGHVRREDGADRIGAIIAGAIRELQEELRIYADRDDLRLLGSVFMPSEGSTKKHMAFVYEWRALHDYVEIALCNSEFIEKTGASLQGMFASPEEIAREGDQLEEWSQEILNEFIIDRSNDETSDETSVKPASA